MKHIASPFVVLAVTACAQATGTTRQLELSPPAERAVSVRPKLTVDSLLETLSVHGKVGQLIMPWLSGSYVATEADAFDTAAAWVEEFGVGGIIISVGSPLDAAAKLNRLQRRSRLPLMVAADLEYGAAMRMIGATAFPMPMAFGATGRELDAYQLGRITALEARAIGIHWTFSPVSDVNNNPANPIINTRSFGESPDAVAKLVAAYIRGASDHGIFTTAKHFPGHGDTGTDSHIQLPVLDACWDRLDSIELVPFRAAIEAGVTSVMTAHIALTCFDGQDPLPATLSPSVMTGVLRDSLGFEGIVVTDALTMGAIISRFGVGESVVRAFLAGSDLLLMPNHLGDAVEAMVAAIDSGRITLERLDRSVRRMLVLKEKAGLFAARTVPLDSIPATVGRRTHQDVADDIAARALTLIQQGPLSQFRDERTPTAVITYADETNHSIGSVLIRELVRHGDTIARFRIYPTSGPMSYDSARSVIRANPRVVFASSVRPISARGHVALPDALADLIVRTGAEKPTVLVSFGSPYLMSQIPSYSGTFLLAWNAVSANERAVANALAGIAAITGKSPTTLSDRFPIGHGITVPAR